MSCPRDFLNRRSSCLPRPGGIAYGVHDIAPVTSQATIKKGRHELLGMGLEVQYTHISSLQWGAADILMTLDEPLAVQ